MHQISSRTCTACASTLPLSEFNHKSHKCRPCQSLYRKEHYAQNKEEYKTRSAARYQEKKQVYNVRATERRLNKTFGITTDEYKRLREASPSCALCLGPFDAQGAQLDHCHTTGKVREFLCARCNRGIGMFDDSVEKLKQAIQYLEKHASK